MDKPLSNLDYLIKRENPQTQQQQRPQGSRGTADAPVDQTIEEAVLTLATPVLRSLRKRNDRCTVFELVDELNIGVNQLRPVLDLIAERFGWIALQHIDLKGDDPVVLTDRGRTYLEKIPG